MNISGPFRGHGFIKRKKRLLCGWLCLLLTAAVTAGLLMPAVPAHAVELTNDSIKAKEAQISDAKTQRDQLKSSLSDLESIKAGLEQSKSDLQAYITQLDASVTEIQAKIDDLNQQIEDKKEEILQTEEELKEAQQTLDSQYEAMKARVKFMYERGDGYILDELMSAGSFAQMLNKADYIEAVSAYDRKKLQEYMEQKKLVKLTKEALEEEQETLEDTEAAAEQEEANLQELIQEKSVEIAGIEDSISDQEESIEEYQKSIAEQDSEISALEAAVKAEREALEEANRPHYNGGMFTWPCPSCTSISSEFGWRVHPIYGDNRFHSGIDIPASYGASIVAAYAGTVVAASYSSSMGNYVMISHGDGLYTIYMHASSLYVSQGQSVSAGQQIAAVGSTGNSTGPHLHFSVRLNGEYVSPWNYLG